MPFAYDLSIVYPSGTGHDVHIETENQTVITPRTNDFWGAPNTLLPGGGVSFLASTQTLLLLDGGPSAGKTDYRLDNFHLGSPQPSGSGEHLCNWCGSGLPLGTFKWVLHESDEFPARCNLEMVALEKFEEPEDVEMVRDLLIQHAGYTKSTVAARLLGDWEWAVTKFVKVMPVDYRRILDERKRRASEATRAEAEVAAGVGR